jgi:hypothetical protein
MREFIALPRECLSGAEVTFAGDYYQVRGFRLGVELGGCHRRSRRPSGRPPIAKPPQGVHVCQPHIRHVPEPALHI